ncbi:MAG: DNA adenine methylase [Bdellovibrionota bacterium]
MTHFNLNTKAKPILKWAGGKSGVLPKLLETFPTTFKRYLEPFIGGGAVFFALNKNVPTIINDVNIELCNLYEVIRSQPHELMVILSNMANKYSEEYYYELRSKNFSCPVEKAARTVFLNKTGFNGLYRQNSKGGFNVPFGKRVKCPALYDSKNLLSVSNRLKSATISNLDFEKIIDEAGPGDFVYCDPPYEPLSVTSCFNAYHGGGFSQNDQRRLRDACVRAAQRGAFVAVSNSTADYILNIYQDWDIRRIRAKRSINSKGDSRGEIEEVVVLLGSV